MELTQHFHTCYFLLGYHFQLPKSGTILVYRRAYLLCYCHTLALVTLFLKINLETSPGVTQVLGAHHPLSQPTKF